MRLAIVDDDLFLRHECPAGHPERPPRLTAVRRGMATSRWQQAAEHEVKTLAPRDASQDELLRVHSDEHLATLAATAGRSGYLDPDTFFSEQSYSATLRACGGALALTDAILEGNAEFGFGALRPPGHHACPDRAMGFCLLNNVAVAVRHAQSRGAGKVVVLDWDVHHGNGTQDVFYEDPSVLYVSLHQWPQYPGTGRCEEVGARDGTGTTLNVPLPTGSGDGLYLHTFDALLVPVIEQFEPAMIFVSAGYDAHVRDPLGGMRLSSAAYGAMVQKLMPLSSKLVFLLEGGYDLLALEESVSATLDGLLGHAMPTVAAAEDEQRLEAVALAVDTQRRFWRL